MSWHMTRSMPLLFVFLLGALVSGCSVYPLPEDVTGYESRHLLRVVRCQARDALRHKYKKIWLEFKDRPIYEGKTGRELGEWLDEDTRRYKTLRWDKFSPYAAPTFKALAYTSINYDFTIDSSENNAAGIDLALLRGVAGGTSTIGITAKNDRTRQVKRVFRNYDDFTSLLIGLRSDYCNGVPETINALYPAAGLTRINTLIEDFIEQNQDDNLGSKERAEDAEMSDTITFSTKFVGNFDPGITKPAALGGYVPSSLKLTADNYRLDIHTIIILIRLPHDKSKLPRFDADGYLTAAPAEKRTVDDKLDQIRFRNTEDAIKNISNTLMTRTSPF